MTVVVRTDILSSLQAMHGDVQRRAAELDRYRALKAIEQTIADFSGLDDVTHALGDIRDRVQQQLDSTREFRALRTIERILPELSEVLGLLDEQAKRDPDPHLPDVEPDASASDGAPADDRGAVTPAQAAADNSRDIETVVLADASEQLQDLPPDLPDHGQAAEYDMTVVVQDQADRETLEERHPVRPESATSQSEAAPVPSLADSVAHQIDGECRHNQQQWERQRHEAFDWIVNGAKFRTPCKQRENPSHSTPNQHVNECDHGGAPAELRCPRHADEIKWISRC